MGGTHPCSRASLPMRWSVDGRHPPLLTCLSAHALERGWEAPTLAHVPLCPCAGAWMGGTHPCSRASLPMRWSVDGRHPPLLTCLFAHALERGWEAPTLAHVPLCPCVALLRVIMQEIHIGPPNTHGCRQSWSRYIAPIQPYVRNHHQPRHPKSPSGIFSANEPRKSHQVCSLNHLPKPPCHNNPTPLLLRIYFPPKPLLPRQQRPFETLFVRDL